MSEVESITTAKAKRTNNAADWTPKDVIEDMLKRINNGMPVSGLVVAFYEEHEGGLTDVRFSASVPNVIMATGVLHRAISLLGEPAG